MAVFGEDICLDGGGGITTPCCGVGGVGVEVAEIELPHAAEVSGAVQEGEVELDAEGVHVALHHVPMYFVQIAGKSYIMKK